jgi:hypothetical protein
VQQSSPKFILAEGDLTENDHLVIELVDPADTPQLVVVHWADQGDGRAACGVRRRRGQAMRLLASADVELARLRRTRGRPKVE